MACISFTLQRIKKIKRKGGRRKGRKARGWKLSVPFTINDADIVVDLLKYNNKFCVGWHRRWEACGVLAVHKDRKL